MPASSSQNTWINAKLVTFVSPLRCRQIEEADISAIAALLTHGFSRRDRQFWPRAFEQLKKHEPPAGLPKYGYLMESGDRPVGVILLICSTIQEGEKVATRCNLSSWYVEPYFRIFAPLLRSQVLQEKNVTYLNVSADFHTWQIIEAQGFKRYCDGVFIAVPALNGLFGGTKAKVIDARRGPVAHADKFEETMLLEHAQYGCISLWCVTERDAYPFIFRRRFAKGVIPGMQLIYCRDIALFVRFAKEIGRYLAMRGSFFVRIDANGPIAGVIGRFRRSAMPRYFKGPHKPRLGDLAYTEFALLGF